jgi:hypothetical protein
MNDNLKPASGLPDYQSYLLRLWRENDEIIAQVLWRASLQITLTGEQVNFPNLESLFTYLRKQTGIYNAENEKK